MTEIIGPIERAGGFPLDKYGTVADLIARDSIPVSSRYDGFSTYVTSLQMTFVLKGGILNADWALPALSDKNYVHTQGVASATWNVTHGLGKFPSITVVDTGGSVVEGDIFHTDNNNAILTFSAPFTGEAFCN